MLRLALVVWVVRVPEPGRRNACEYGLVERSLGVGSAQPMRAVRPRSSRPRLAWDVARCGRWLISRRTPGARARSWSAPHVRLPAPCHTEEPSGGGPLQCGWSSAERCAGGPCVAAAGFPAVPDQSRTCIGIQRACRVDRRRARADGEPHEYAQLPARIGQAAFDSLEEPLTLSGAPPTQTCTRATDGFLAKSPRLFPTEFLD